MATSAFGGVGIAAMSTDPLPVIAPRQLREALSRGAQTQFATNLPHGPVGCEHRRAQAKDHFSSRSTVLTSIARRAEAGRTSAISAQTQSTADRATDARVNSDELAEGDATANSLSSARLQPACITAVVYCTLGLASNDKY